MPQMPIPDDWDGETYTLQLVCWPDSVLWNGILRGLITVPTRGRYWDAKTGSVVGAQAIGQEIIDKNIDSQGEIMGCADVVTALDAIAAAVTAIKQAQVNIEVSAEAQATSAAQANAIMVDLSRQIAISQAWAQSIAETNLSVTIENNVSLTIGSVSPARPPLAAQEPETGISVTPVPSGEYCDKATYLVDAGIAYIKALQDLSLGIGDFTISAMYGWIAEALAAIPLLTGAGLPTPIMPAVVLAAAAGEIYGQALRGVFRTTAQEAKDFLDVNRESLICLFYNAAIAEDETSVIRELFETEALGQALSQQAVNLLLGFYNPAALALLYYVASTVTIPATTFDCDEFCGN